MNTARWALFRAAVQTGQSWEAAYDTYLYPRTRIPDTHPMLQSHTETPRTTRQH